MTPWHKSSTQVAYLAYFFPLNFIRVSWVLRRLEPLGFFQGLNSYVDFGSGLGTVEAALNEQSLMPGRGRFIERAAVARSLHQSVVNKQAQFVDSGSGDLGVMSYALTELKEVPGYLMQSEGLLIIEPGTKEDAAGLVRLRSKLLEDGFGLVGPCPHEARCPLMDTRDWCHMRFRWNMPQWFEAIEEHLPIKNQVLTVSYLAARRGWKNGDTHPVPANGIPIIPNLVRVIGQPLREKGRIRQLVCRGEDREFLMWQLRDGEPRLPQSGDLVRIPEDTVKKSDTLRIQDYQLI
jgi:hypothetical protein